jgi:hypothetical protein
MSFRADRRGQSMQIGAMLLFGLLVVAAASYQVTVVPQQNADVEFTHGEAVRTDLLNVRNSVLRTALDGGLYPVTVELGTSYPPRTVFVNPPPATGTLSTAPPGGGGMIEIRHATVEAGGGELSRRETGDFWTGVAWSHPTTTLTYEPRYSSGYQPTTTYENSVLSHRYGDGSTVPATGQTLVRDRTVSLVVLSGELSITSADAVGLDPVAVSAGTRTVPITATAGENVEIVVPTRLSEEMWRDLLQEQFVGQGGYVESVSVVDGTLTIGLLGSDDDGQVTYDLRLANVGVGSAAGAASPAYVTFVDEGDRIVTAGTRQAFTVEVRDAFDDPVSGVELSARIVTGGGTVDPTSAVTDEQGRASFVHEAPGAGTDESVASITFGTGSHGGVNGPKEARFAVTVTDSGSAGESDTTDIALRVDDLTDRRSNKPSFVASYDLTSANRDFTDVEISFTSEDGNPSGTMVGTLPRGSVRFEPGYGTDEEFDVVLRATYEGADGTRLVQSRAIVDRADGRTYAGANDDLTSTDELVTFDVTDHTDTLQNDPRYVIDYEVESADLREVEIAALSLDAGGASARTTLSSPEGTGVELRPGDGAGSEYRLKLLVYDGSGAVVETASLTDVADGTGVTG